MTGKSESEVASNLGSLWWRADQFLRRGTADARKASAAAPATPEANDAIGQMLVDMGLLAHFTGDASMPFHNDSDYDGWKSGHGGIHVYYEQQLLESMGLGLPQKVLDRAQALLSGKAGPPPMRGGTLLERMKALSSYVVGQIPAILKLDRVTKPSDAEKKVAAERRSADAAIADFENYIVDQLARSALLTAQAWDELYEKGGAPDLTHYRRGAYPLAPPYVPPDYLPEMGPCPVAELATKPK
jgi:hypothetical protein